MYKQIKPSTTGLKVNQSKEGETIEQKVNRIVNNKEPIKDGAPIIFTDRKDGVLPQYDIRTDRWEHAIEMTDTASKAHTAKREDNMLKRTMGEEAYNNMKKEQESKNTGGEPTQATSAK